MFDQAIASVRRGAHWAAAALAPFAQSPRLRAAIRRVATLLHPTRESPTAASRRPRRRRFVLEGALIVVPALLLAGVGFWSLRKDRALARAEAADRAQQAAVDLAKRLTEALVIPLESIPVDDRFGTTAGRANADPVWQCARLDPPRVAFLVDNAARLRFPLPVQTWPFPRTLDLSELPPVRRPVWQAAQAALFAEADPAAAVTAFQAFLAETPPVAFAAQAAYTLGVLYARQGKTDRARPWFETVVREYPEATGEAGGRLRVWAELQLLQHGTNTAGAALQRAAWLRDVCAEAVLRPSPLSRSLLTQATALADGAEQAATITPWLEVWDAHEFARRWSAVWRLELAPEASDSSGWPVFAWLALRSGQRWLVTRATAPDAPADSSIGNAHWIVAVSRTDAERLVERLVDTLPNRGYLDFRIRVADATLREPAGAGEALVLHETAAPGNAPPLISVGAFLTDPQALYARQRTRTRVFGSLIVLAVLAVLAGFVTAWRAFRRQQQLNELQINFVSSVSHELRAPIASVRLMAEELHEGPAPATAPARDYHRFILQETRRLSALIENVLDFARHEQGRQQYEFEPTDVTGLVTETTALMCMLAADRRVTITPQLPAAPVTWELDGRAVQQVLVNLLDNAIKHAPANSIVTVGLAIAAGTKRPAAPPRLQLWVEDQGEGIPPEEQEQIFERFYRCGSELRRRTQGVGLGLAIVKYAVAAHGGQVRVRSGVGQGSRFTVELPGRHESEPAAEAGHESVTTPPTDPSAIAAANPETANDLDAPPRPGERHG